ncbi:fibronectin type III domain-containing protein [Nocardiopsis sp. N85]|uniref:fibronectin type III domain-containing protein n=1 Tax=Nocardiopsis sp. N85 TaxID=3029400 RepID=UPI00237F08A4|nr:fibronectin type III domain-containing protein [Nocardiopsis sp. N85]MDE3723146.1 fibronectin type III domain-containing protein [Nocardiopsis sp. N85]
MAPSTASPATPKHPSRKASVARLFGSLRNRARAHASGLTVVLLTAALVSTVLGTGALGRTDEMSDGAVWLWTSPLGEASRVNGNSGEVDLVAGLPESAGTDIRVVQNDDHLLLYDPVTGKVTSVDLLRMGFSGVLELGAGDFDLVLGEEAAVVIGRASGEVKAVDPATLQPTGETLRIPAPLVGGAFDDEGTLWLGVPTQGTVVGVEIPGDEAVIERTAAVAEPGADLSLTVLDEGAFAVDRSGDRLVTLGADGDTEAVDAPLPVEGAEMPARTRGDLVAVTLPGSGEVLTVTDPHGAVRTAHFAVGEGAGTAVAYEGRVYVPFADEGLVRVFDAEGVELTPVTLPEAEGPLEMEVREGRLFINSPRTGVAAVVDPDGRATIVDKSDPPPGLGDEEDGAPAPGAPELGDTGEPDPLPGTDPGPGPSATVPGDNGPADVPGIPGPGDRPGEGQGGGQGEPEVPEPEVPEDPEPEGGPPGAPTPVSATAGDGSASLSWPEAYSPDAPVEEYHITWNDGELTVGGDELTVEITGLTNGTAYRFRVRAVNAHGLGPAAQSMEVTPGERAPGAPASVTAQATGSENATVSWTAVDGAHDYLVTIDAASGTDPSDRTSTGTSADVSGLTPGETYTFTVTARTQGGVSGAPTGSRPLTMPEAALGAPASVSHSVSGANVTVTWTLVEGAARYTITPSGDGGLQPVTVAGDAAGGGSLSHTMGRGASGRCYAFTVVAVAGDGTVAQSSTSGPSRCEQEFR